MPPDGNIDNDNKDIHLSERLAEAEALDPTAAAKSRRDTLNVSFGGGIRAPSPDSSLFSIEDFSNVRLGRYPDRRHGSTGPRRSLEASVPRPRTLKGKAKQFWAANKGLALVMIAQFFGSLMNVTTRMLEVEGNHGTLAAYEYEISMADILL